MSEKTVVEINGVKLEVDMRYARRIEEIRVGSPVKILIKNGYGGHKVHAGIVIGFEPFKDLPTILVAYVEEEYNNASIKVVPINSSNKEYDLVAAVDKDFTVDREVILKKFNRQIAQKQREIEALMEQVNYFQTNFAAFWGQVTPQHEPETNLDN